MEAHEFIKDLQMVRGLLDGFTEWNRRPVFGRSGTKETGYVAAPEQVATYPLSLPLESEIDVSGKILDLLAVELGKGTEDKWEEVPFSMRHRTEILEDVEGFLQNNEVYQNTSVFGKERWEKVLDGKDDIKDFLEYVKDPANLEMLTNGRTKVREIYNRNPFREFKFPEVLSSELLREATDSNHPYQYPASQTIEGQLDLLKHFIEDVPFPIPTPLGGFYYTNLLSHLLTIYSLLSAIQDLTHEKQSGTNGSGSAISPKESVGKDS